jgi:hypothetical protein
MTPTGRLDDEEDEHEASLDLKPLPWLHCALLICLASALCYGLGYLVVDLLARGAL